MSKRVVALHNNTKKQIFLVGSASGKTPSDFPPTGRGFPQGRHSVEFDIPDNSDPPKYWETNRVEVLIPGSGGLWSERLNFWDDDYDDFKIKYSRGDAAPPPDQVKLMRGGDQGGNYAKVALHVFEHPLEKERYELTAVEITEANQRKELASRFKEFINTAGVNPDGKHSAANLIEYMGLPAFKTLKEVAREY